MTVKERFHQGPCHDGRVIVQRDINGDPEVWLARYEGALTFCHASPTMPVIPVRDDAQFEHCLELIQEIYYRVLLILGSNSK